MKKLLIVLAVASLGFVACNNESATEETKDSVAATIDANATEVKDSINKVADSLTQKVDSVAGAAIDSLKK